MMQLRAKGGTLVSGPTEVLLRMAAQGAKPVSLRKKHVERRQNLGRPARVLAVVHGWMPYLAAGSERMLQHMLDALPREEFEVTVLTLGFGDNRFPLKPYEYQGTPVYVGYTSPIEPDIIVTHHGPAARVVQLMSQEYPNARIVTVYHNDRYEIPDIQDLNAELEVFNTEWIKDSLNGEGIVVHPPLEFDRHATEMIGDAVTLVNLSENKGVRVFHELAARMPDLKFLGVEGTHGEQEYRRSLPNVEYMATTQDMREVWRKSHLVLMPSGYESYGMVAAEACVNGIPVVAHQTPGLVECLGSAGVFVDRTRPDDWERAVHLLMTDRNHWLERSDMVALRAKELVEQSKRELARFVDEMRALS